MLFINDVIIDEMMTKMLVWMTTMITAILKNQNKWNIYKFVTLLLFSCFLGAIYFFLILMACRPDRTRKGWYKWHIKGCYSYISAIGCKCFSVFSRYVICFSSKLSSNGVSLPFLNFILLIGHIFNSVSVKAENNMKMKIKMILRAISIYLITFTHCLSCSFISVCFYFFIFMLSL